TSIFPPERRGTAFGVWGGVAGLATLAGPTVGGAIITYVDWRWIFYINVPIGIASLIATFLVIPDLRPGRRHGWDVVGIVVATAISFGMLSMFLPFTIYLQSARGFSALVAGLTLAPMSLTSMFTAPFAGRMADRVGGKYILMTGILLFTIGMASLGLVAGPDSTWINFLVPAAVAGLGIGMTFAPMTTVAMRNVSPRVAGSASAVLNTIRQLGAAIGSAVIGALLQNRLATTLHDQAVSHASALPDAFRSQFIAAFSNVSSKGFEIGTGESGARLPGNLPPSVAHQLAVVAHDVFASAYTDALKSTFVLPIACLLFTALTTVLIKRRPRAAVQQEAKEEVRAAAG